MDWYLVFLIVLIGFFVAAAVLYKFVFLRSPKRTIPKGNTIVSPADGKVIEVLPYDDAKSLTVEKGLGKIFTHAKDISPRGYMITIFMGLLDVHINRAPIEGTITTIKHKAGKFGSATNPNALMENEHTETVIQGKDFKVKVIQIAGVLARRIKTFVKKRQHVEKGQEIGMIVIGSQATLIVPDHVTIAVHEGDKVKAGSSVIARY